MLVNALRELRHGPLKQYDRVWLWLGKLYRRFLLCLPCLPSVSMKIGGYGPFRLHPYFAFSNFAAWGGDHNNGFDACVEACRGKRCVLDVGAHIGLVSLPLSRVIDPAGVVVAFEPAAINRRCLLDHIRRSRCHNIHVCEDLVGDQVLADVPFFEQAEPTGMNGVVVKRNPEKYQRSLKAQITLDQYCHQRGLMPEVIKIDVEGAEIDVLRGARGIIRQSKPQIFLSVHPKEIELHGQSLTLLQEEVSALGYELRQIDGSAVDTLALQEYLMVPTII